MIILHGENLVASRQQLSTLKENFSGEIISFAGEKLNLTQLKQALESLSIFKKEKLIIIENLFTRQSSQEKESLLKYLKESQPENLIVWEGKTIDGRSLTPFKLAKIQKFTLSALIFKFVDSLAPQNKRNSLYWLGQCLKKDAPEVVFYMLSRQIRLLIIAKDLGAKDLTRLAPWQKAKFVNQAQKFTLKQLVNLYQRLLQIDWQQKTGQSALPLASQLDLLIASF